MTEQDPFWDQLSRIRGEYPGVGQPDVRGGGGTIRTKGEPYVPPALLRLLEETFPADVRYSPPVDAQTVCYHQGQTSVVDFLRALAAQHKPRPNPNVLLKSEIGDPAVSGGPAGRAGTGSQEPAVGKRAARPRKGGQG